MPEAAVETVAAESSPAVVEAPVVEAAPAKPAIDPLQEGPMVTWTREQRNEFRTTGKMPEAKPKADPAPAKELSEAKAESVTESETAKQQEHTEKPKPKQTAEERIAQLEATIEKIRKGAGIERTAKPESSTTEPAPKTETKPAPPQNYQEWRKAFKPSQWVEEYAKANPESSYEDATAAMSDFLGDVRDQFRQRDEQMRAQNREINEKIADAKTRYPNFDEVIQPAVDLIANDQAISPVVKAMLNESEVLPDLAFTIASKPQELANFIKMAKESPGKALRYIALTETLIRDELEHKSAPAAAHVEATPAKLKTSAPPPPVEVGGRASAPGDSLVAAAAANDFRTFKAELNRRELAKLKAG